MFDCSARFVFKLGARSYGTDGQTDRQTNEHTHNAVYKTAT